MADKVDMSLDDIIKMNKINKRPQNYKNGTSGFRRNQQSNNNNNRSNNVIRNNNNFRQTRRTNPYSRPTQVRTGDNKWKHDLFDGNNKPATIMIGNLHFRVSDNDIKELFKEFGQIKKAAVHYDKSGRSLGNAEVVFNSKISARKAIEKYNDVQLDGRKMKITMVSDKPIVSQSPRIQQQRIGNRINQNNRSNGNSNFRNGNSNGNSNFRNGNSNGFRGNRQGNAKKNPTKEDLDAELDAYVNKS